MRPIDADELEELWAGISPNATVHPDSVIDTIKRAKTIKDNNQVPAHWIPEYPNKRTGKAYSHTCSKCGKPYMTADRYLLTRWDTIFVRAVERGWTERTVNRMSNQEAIALLRNLEDALDSYCELNEEGKTAFRMAIEALNCSENPNNSDCISRQAAIDAVDKRFDSIPMEQTTEILLLRKDLRNLPSAQPQRMRGKWTYGEDEYSIDGYHCDKCGFFVPWDYTHKFIDFIKDYHFCPNCGADMRGEQDDSV